MLLRFTLALIKSTTNVKYLIMLFFGAFPVKSGQKYGLPYDVSVPYPR